MRIGIIGDLHLPFTHRHYLDFVADTFRAWRVTHTHFIGDIVDNHALSFWDSDPNGHSAEDEARAAAEGVAIWRDAFPRATVSIGNHDERHYRKAAKAGVPERYLRSYAEVWQTPRWDWQLSHEHDGVLYEHGTGSGGAYAAFNRAKNKRRSVVMGHIHTGGGVNWHANDRDRIFGLNVGCGIDCAAYAMAYSRPFPTRPTLGCGIVIDGRHAYFEVMTCEDY